METLCHQIAEFGDSTKLILITSSEYERKMIVASFDLFFFLTFIDILFMTSKSK